MDNDILREALKKTENISNDDILKDINELMGHDRDHKTGGDTEKRIEETKTSEEVTKPESVPEVKHEVETEEKEDPIEENLEKPINQEKTVEEIRVRNDKKRLRNFNINSEENQKSAVKGDVSGANLYYTQIANVPRKFIKDIQALVPEARNKDEAVIAYIVETNDIVLTQEDNEFLNVDKINYLAQSIKNGNSMVDSVKGLRSDMKKIEDLLSVQKDGLSLNYIQSEKILLALSLLLAERLGLRSTSPVSADKVSFMEENMLILLKKLSLDVQKKIKLDKEQRGRPIR